MNIITLDQAVIQALNLFSQNPVKPSKFSKTDIILAAGSGNAYNTAQIIFGESPAIYADESNLITILKKFQPLIKTGLIKRAIIISASGEKDAVWMTTACQKNHLSTELWTCTPNSSATKIASHTKIFKKALEPYTYNTSTYLGMILGATQENPQEILKFIKKLKIKNLRPYTSYSFLLPDKFSAIAPMLDIKRHELFGPHLSLRAFSFGGARHAKFVHRDPKELIISLGETNKYFGYKNSTWNIKLPKNISFAGIFAISYYLVGQIQKIKPPYFQKDIQGFCEDYGPKAYAKKQKFNLYV